MEWWVSMPKVELHAHLNGSIRHSTLLELARALGEKGVIDFSELEHVILKRGSYLLAVDLFPDFTFDDPYLPIDIEKHNAGVVYGFVNTEDRSLREVFELFDLIHIITTDHMTVTRITKEVIEDFAAENVVYLELRTTPKANGLIGMSKRSYVEAVLKGLRAVSTVDVDFMSDNENSEILVNSLGPTTNHRYNVNTRKRIVVRLLLSIDRRETTEAAKETVLLALEMKHLGVVGIDLSGNPVVGEWITYLPALKYAREQGLHITLHCGEVRNSKEIRDMLNFLPQRIGHAIFLDEEDWEKLKSYNIPVEICLTSNIRTLSVPSLDVHHFVDLYNAKHPVVLCTDDTGVFSTSLSDEYRIAASTFGLGRKEMFELSKNSVEFVFADNGVKEELRSIFNSAAKSFI